MSYTPVGWWDDGVHPLSQANMKTVDAGLISAHKGWRPITSGALETQATSIPIDVPAGFSMVRLNVVGRLVASPSTIGVMFNSASNDHLWFFEELVADGTSNTFQGVSSSASVTRWSNVRQNTMSIQLLTTTGRCSYLSEGSQTSLVAASRTRCVGSGSLSADATLSSLTVVSGVNFQTGEGSLGTSWILEGYRA